MDLAVNLQLPHAPRDELGVLAAEVEDEDLFFVNVNARHGVPRLISNLTSQISEHLHR